MRLIGFYLSPFVRRVAVSLSVLNLPFELEEVLVFGEPELVRNYNPLVRIPILVLEDGTKLFESGAILDEIDRMVTPERRLVPDDGPLRRQVVQTTAIALACAEKAQWAMYEGRVRPAEKIHAPWVAHNDNQVLGGFEHLNRTAEKLDDDNWMAGTAHTSQADLTTGVAFSFAKVARPDLRLAGRFPGLERLADRCEALPAFVNAPMAPSPKLSDLLAKPQFM
jgi:glutathione S-transferase